MDTNSSVTLAVSGIHNVTSAKDDTLKDSNVINTLGSPLSQPSITLLPTEDSIRENITRHKEAILHCLLPEQLQNLLCEIELSEICTTPCMTRQKQAELLLNRLQHHTYLTILRSLENDKEHMGHKYIVSLLKGEEFAREEEIEDSKHLKEKLCHSLQLLNVEELIPHLYSSELITGNEKERLTSPLTTTEDKARTLFSLLKTKGPTAFRIFVKKCLAIEGKHLGHKELYQQLTAPKETRKRRASSCTTVSKRSPHLLDTPEGITTANYIEKIRRIRQYHLNGRWKAAENTINGEIQAPENPLEIKIAVLLESCNSHVLNRKPDEVLAIVDQARTECTRLYTQEGNAQVLEGRCEWVLARMYQFEGDLEQAQTHIDTAFALTANCYMGEEMILINFVNGSIILDGKTKSRQKLNQAVHSFKSAITLASEEDYGMKMAQYCKINLALAYIGSSIFKPAKSRGGVSQDNIDEARKVVNDMEQEEMHIRTRWPYLLACSDVYRLDGQMDQAKAFIDQASKLAHENKLLYETKLKCLEIRQKYLQDT